MSEELKNIDEVLELNDGQKYLSCVCKRLLPPGENYGSVMLQIEIKILNESGEEEIIHCVGKTCPPSEFILELFNTKVTFKKEIAVYKIIAPILRSFAEEYGLDRPLDFFAKCLGSRISLDKDSDVVDKDAIILLENLKVKGYQLKDRFVGFDLKCTKLILKDLAALHAVVIAYKSAKPKEFDEKFRPFLNRDFSFSLGDTITSKVIEDIQKNLGKNPGCVPYLAKIEESIRKLTNYHPNAPLKERELFATFTHNDYWLNNTMLRFENDEPVNNKILDFQIIEYRSLAHDIIFFLYSSVDVAVLETNIDEFFKFYHNEFIKILKKLKCSFTQFTYEELLKEFAYIGREEELGHIMFMMPGIMTLREKAKELTEFKKDEVMMEEESIHPHCWKKLSFVLMDFAQRGWV